MKFLRALMWSVFALALLADSAGRASAQPRPSIGPAKGWLILHGGGIDLKHDYEHYHRFVDLAGGHDASIVVILTPVDLNVITNDFLTKYKQWWKSEFGLADVTFMDTRDRKEAESESFVAPLRKATGVYILGGHLTTCSRCISARAPNGRLRQWLSAVVCWQVLRPAR
jgi:cyanophycinase